MNISGQVIVRDSGEHRDGKRLVMVVGVLAVPDDFLENHYQYTLVGDAAGGSAFLVLRGDGVDRTEVCKGASLAHLVCEPIWSV